jgi:two-component SAPR family response regulator
VYWKKIAEFQSVIFPQFTFDSISNNLYILNPNELIRYSIANGTEEHIESKPEVRGKFYNELLFDPIFSRLMFYRMETGSTYFFNPANHTWEGYEDSDKEPAHAHHNRYISVKDSSLYLFGGYGFYKYHSDFFKTNLVSRQNSIFDFSHTITPRYLSAMGGSAKENKLYILGGRGAEMGRQELSPKNFTNLFEVNLKTFKVKHLFDIETNETGENVYANSLVVDPDGKNLYALAYPYTELTSTITLKKINLETQQTEILANPLYFHFQDITSFCDLYYSPKLSKLIAVIAWSDNRQTSKIQIYTLDYLPLKENDVLQTVSHQSHLKFIFIAAFLLVAFLILDLFLYRKKRRVKSNAEEKKPKNEENTIVKAESAERKKDDRLFYNARKNSILFLGGFEVFDKNGDNITGEFTPTLKYMLVLIILYTLKNKKGISSGKLQELLWFDKNEQAARNNRNVNLRRLRVLLQNLGSIDISDNNAYWVIRLPDNVLSDYKEVLTLIAQMKNDDEVRREDLLRMLELLSYGEMLPNIQFEWVDDFKTHFSNTVIDTLTTILNNDKNTLCESPDIQLKIADALLKIDSINEEAIGIKCKLLVKMGKKGLAKITFDTFNKEYKILMGEPYSGSIKNFLD